jgi:hypothetical protein
MVITLGPAFVDKKGEVLLVRAKNIQSVYFPICFWVDGYFGRTGRLLSWSWSDKLRFLIETNDAVQVLIELNDDTKPSNIFGSVLTYEAQIAISYETSEYNNNGKRWLNHCTKKAQYPYCNLFHFTEKSCFDKIEKSKILKPSNWSMSGREEVPIKFCYFTDKKSIKYAWDFFEIAIVRENYPENMFLENDNGLYVPSNIKRVNKELDSRFDFQVDMRLAAFNPIVYHFKTLEEWWEVFMPCIYRIACSSISLQKHGNLCQINKNQVNDYRICNGFYLAQGADVTSMQVMFDDMAIEQFFE